MSLWLTPSELVELTGYKQRRKQYLELAKLHESRGLKFTVRERDGFPLVDRSQFTSGESLPSTRRRREPNFSTIGRS